MNFSLIWLSVWKTQGKKNKELIFSCLVIHEKTQGKKIRIFFFNVVNYIKLLIFINVKKTFIV